MENKKLDSQTLFYFCFGLWYGTEIFFKSTISLPNIESFITFFVSFLLFIQIVFFQSYDVEELVKIIPISAIIAVSTINSGEFYLLSAWLFVVAFKDADMDRVMRISFKMLTVGILTIIILFTIGVIPEVTIYRGHVLRHSLGFDHPNQMGMAFFQWVLCYCYLYWDMIGIPDIVLFSALSYIVYYVADSQTSIVCISIVILFLIITKILDYCRVAYQDLLSKICSLSSLIIMLGSMALTWIDVKTNTFLNLMDLVLSRRFYYCHKVLSIYGLSVLGQRVYISDNEREYIRLNTELFLDNAYAAIWIKYGVIMVMIFIIGYYILYKVASQTTKITVILFTFSVFGIMGSGFYRLYRNTFLLLFGYLIYRQKPLPESLYPSEEIDEKYE